MFARVFDTARRVLNRSPEPEEANQDIPKSVEADAEKMVTTRRGTGTAGSVESTPRSSTRKTRGKRELEAEVQDTPTASKRRRKATAKEEPVVEHVVEETQQSVEQPTDERDNEGADTIVVAMPHRTKGARDISAVGENTPAAHRSGSPKVIISTQTSKSFDAKQESGLAPAEPASVTGPIKGRRRSKRVDAASPEKPVSESKFPDEILSSTWNSEEAPLSPNQRMDTPATVVVKEKGPSTVAVEATQSTVIPASTLEGKERHKRFNSEEPEQIDTVDTIQQEEHEVEPENHEDDNTSDSDEAPEMVTTSAAASKARATADEASRALQAQRAEEQKRRQLRADRVAQEQAEKRKRGEKKAQKLAKREAKLTRLQQREASSRGASSPPRAPAEVDMHGLPDLLPDSLLEAVGDRRPPTPPPVRVGKTTEELRKEKMNRHIKFLERGEKPVKDVKKGKVNVSVLAQQNMLLAPKVNRDTKNIREHWLKGREANRKGKGPRKGTAFKKMERRPVGGGGFLRSGNDD
ncbi:hypothetical protein N0V90_007854 [Kalmusia sp. IMI 367209]|nr:hypothetical protein N0V90_007854 [Kalmusia sp. IMI 367209]